MKRQNTTRTRHWLFPVLMLGAGCAGEDKQSAAAPPFMAAGGGALPPASSGVAGASVVAPSPTPSSMTPPTAAAMPGVPTSMGPAATAGTGAPAKDPAVGAAGAGAPAANGSNAGAPMNDCAGIKLEGLMYSPGGTVLPNKCEPFHPTKNNPYAVRCVDAWPWFKTKFPGDESCILPPPPDKGVQYGVHPQGAKWHEQVSKGDMSGYDNLADEWLMKDGEEESANFETAATNANEAKYYRTYNRMRPGSHHMIVNSDPNKPGDNKWYAVAAGGLLDSAAGLIGAVSLPGAQRPDENRPPSFEKPMEDSGLYRILPKSAKVTFNMHHFNASGQTILKEAWSNVWWEDDARTPMEPMRGLEVGQVLTMAIPPESTQDLHYSWNITQPVRIVEAFGHRHAWTTNFSAWIESTDGKTDILYRSMNWLDEPTYRYDSLTMNPKPTPEAPVDGGASGVRMVMPGQKLHFNCHIEFTAARAMSEKAPTPQQVGTLRFANEAFTGEMCILFGSTVGPALGAPVVDLTPLPAFATAD